VHRQERRGRGGIWAGWPTLCRSAVHLAAPSFALFAKGGNAELLVEEEEELVDREDDFRTLLLVRNSYSTSFQHFTAESLAFRRINE
jgi:hypothetical protein